jgi:dTDP-glucose pyrophosphorylase
MIDPVTVALILFGNRVVTTAERISASRSGRLEHRELVRRSDTLPSGAEVGEIRADGSSWWIRVPAAPAS